MRLWMVAILLMIALAGCADPPAAAPQDLPDEGPNDGSHDAPDDAQGGSEAGNGTLLTAVLVPDAINGTAPLAVSFNVSAEGAGPDATWSLDFGDGNSTNGTALPAAADHTFQAGNFSIVLTVSDGNATAQATSALSVADGAAASGAPLSPVPFAADGMLPVGTQGVEGCGLAGPVDVAEHNWEIPAEVDGVAAKAVRFVLHMEISESNIDSDLFLLDPAGNELGSGTSFNAPGLGTGSPTEDIDIQGSWAPGTYQVVVRACTAVAGSYEITGSAEMVSA